MRITAPTTLYNSLQHRLDVDAQTTDAQRDQLLSIDRSVRNFDEKADAVVNVLGSGQELFDNASKVRGDLEAKYPFLAGTNLPGRVFQAGVGVAGVAVGITEVKEAAEHFKKGQTLLGVVSATGGAAEITGDAIGFAQATFLQDSLDGLPLERIISVSSGLGGVMDGIEDLHEVTHGAEKLGSGLIGGVKIASGALQLAGATFQEPVLETVGSALYLGAVVTQYSHQADRWENDLSLHLAEHKEQLEAGERLGSNGYNLTK